MSNQTDNLSNSDRMTIRHARQALDLLVMGAMRVLETNFGPDDNSDRNYAVDCLIQELEEELNTWIRDPQEESSVSELE